MGSWDNTFSYYCTNSDCNRKIDLSKNDIETKLNVELIHGYEVTKTHDMFDCSECKNDKFKICDANGRLIFDPDLEIRLCKNCSNPISVPRLQTFPDSNVCAASCTGESNDDSSAKKEETDLSKKIPLPTDLLLCKKCRSPTKVQYSIKVLSYFVGCTRWPFCRHISEIPKEEMYKRETKTDALSSDLKIYDSSDHLLAHAERGFEVRDFFTIKKIHEEFKRRITKRTEQGRKPMLVAENCLRRLIYMLENE
jgi:hypothetical protein|tara:strand:+ start:57 stop:812 length:756 start_codon:yes stop_codon:yes gene_type:complete